MYAMKNLNFDSLPLYAPVRFRVPPPPAYVSTFNTEYYPLLITENPRALKTSKFLKVFNFWTTLKIFNRSQNIKWKPKVYKESAMNLFFLEKVEIKRIMQKSKAVYNANYFNFIIFDFRIIYFIEKIFKIGIYTIEMCTYSPGLNSPSFLYTCSLSSWFPLTCVRTLWVAPH